MYLYLLASANREFDSAINRSSALQRRSAELKQVDAAFKQCRERPNDCGRLAALLECLHKWRTKNPKEYADRGCTNGIAYRLWMEARQLLRNNFQRNVAHLDPPLPPNCPGSTLGLRRIYVPPDPNTSTNEICHGFTYRYLIASGKLREQQGVAAMGGAFGDSLMRPILFPGGADKYPPVRANAQMQVREGDAVGVFQGPLLCHSLIVLESSVWFGANNLGTFGLPLGRTEVHFGRLPKIAGSGWQGTDNTWKTIGGGNQTRMVYRRL